MTAQKKRPKKTKREEVGDIFSGPKPWLDSTGMRIPPQILKTLSKHWSKKTWTAYLSSFEKAPRERYVHPGFLEKYSRELYGNIFDLAQSNLCHKVDVLESALKVLPAKHRQVLRMTYWQNMSRREIARALGIPKSNVQYFLADAQRTLRALIYAPTGHFAPIEEVGEPNQEADDDQEVSA